MASQLRKRSSSEDEILPTKRIKTSNDSIFDSEASVDSFYEGSNEQEIEETRYLVSLVDNYTDPIVLNSPRSTIEISSESDSSDCEDQSHIQMNATDSRSDSISDPEEEDQLRYLIELNEQGLIVDFDLGNVTESKVDNHEIPTQETSQVQSQEKSSPHGDIPKRLANCFDFEGKILKIGDINTIRTRLVTLRVLKINLLERELGEIKLTLWNNDCEYFKNLIEVNDYLFLTNLKMKDYRGEKTIHVTRYSRIKFCRGNWNITVHQEM